MTMYYDVIMLRYAMTVLYDALKYHSCNTANTNTYKVFVLAVLQEWYLSASYNTVIA
jgi:hypothetical protein